MRASTTFRLVVVSVVASVVVACVPDDGSPAPTGDRPPAPTGDRPPALTPTPRGAPEVAPAWEELPDAPTARTEVSAAVDGDGRIVVVGTGRADVARAAAEALDTVSGNGSGPAGRVRSTGPLRRLADATEMVADGAAAAVVVEVGRTSAGEIRLASRLIREAGGRVMGAILVARSPAEQGGVWR
ncbi:MAG: hypothetical protein KY453_06305 [Gemmatimonadetes bacterium]|nr:hypothetical protein [Gemmatimonadota bacterium]